MSQEPVCDILISNSLALHLKVLSFIKKMEIKREADEWRPCLGHGHTELANLALKSVDGTGLKTKFSLPLGE